jgi:hypothetical protein
MNNQTWKVILTPVTRERIRSEHYIEATSHAEAKQSALLQQLNLDMEDGAFRRWAAIMVRPLGEHLIDD